MTSDFPLDAVVLDWAGTTIDFGSRAPTAVFLSIFRECGVEISEQEARGPMGRAKHEHIQALLENPSIADRWEKAHGKKPAESDVITLYERFLPLQKQTLSQHADVIPGVVEAIDACRMRGLKIGSTTGYTRGLMEIVAPLAAAQGYKPDVTICSDDVSTGRPAPWMIFAALEKMKSPVMSQVVNVDDTPVGIEAARNAGVWSVGVVQTGNQFGLTAAELAALSADELVERTKSITQEFMAAGAHEVVMSVAELPAMVDLLARRVAQGFRP